MKYIGKAQIMKEAWQLVRTAVMSGSTIRAKLSAALKICWGRAKELEKVIDARVNQFSRAADSLTANVRNDMAKDSSRAAMGAQILLAIADVTRAYASMDHTCGSLFCGNNSNALIEKSFADKLHRNVVSLILRTVNA